MKIAICYSGQPRHFKESLENQKKTLELAKSNEDTIDIFCHFWYDEKMNGKFFWDEYPERGKFDIKIKEWIYEEVRPVKCQFESPIEFDYKGLVPEPRIPHPLFNTFSMFYSIQKCNELKIEYEKEYNFNYDWVIRLRTDLHFNNVIGNLNSFSKDKIHVKNEISHTEYAINDQFAIGSSKLMNLYSNTFSNIFYLSSNGILVNPECLLGGNLKFNNINVEKHNWNYNLFRDFIK